ncbi:MAG: Asp-tRNA(Asn)/Glu-tRNA(Gln) amidotransferase subunit GatB [Candidatus Dormiibacterota bacterium]
MHSANPPTRRSRGDLPGERGGTSSWEVVIGMEVHVQPTTRSKMFCGCAIGELGDPPNSNVCEICLGMPGVLPVINKAAVEACLKTALALSCEIPRHTKFDRKNYMYPDLPKGYQISQYDLPMSVNGHLDLDGQRVRIRRVHLEEDTGKLIHAGDKLHKARESFVDLNRAGVPLMEIVTEPDLRSADEARDYAVSLRTLLRTIGASEAEMEKGQLRAEPNISIRRAGSTELGVKTELKNINSFRALHRAILYEVARQADVLEAGGTVVQETRGWSDAEQRTFSQRSKEFAEDYRYFPEPDLPPLALDQTWIGHLDAEVKASIGRAESKGDAVRDFQERFALPGESARLLSQAGLEDLLGAVVNQGADDAKFVASWMVEELLPRLRDGWSNQLSPRQIAQLVGLLSSRYLSRDNSRRTLDTVWGTQLEPETVAKEKGWFGQVDDGVIENAIDDVIQTIPKAVADYIAGNQRALGVLIKAVTEACGGKADGKRVSELLRKRLG